MFLDICHAKTQTLALVSKMINSPRIMTLRVTNVMVKESQMSAKIMVQSYGPKTWQHTGRVKMEGGVGKGSIYLIQEAYSLCEP